MEIFENIITALSEPNQLMNMVIVIPLLFIDSIVYMLLLTTFLDIKSNRQQKILYVIVMVILCFITRNFIPDPYATILNMLILPCCIYFIFKTSILKACISEIIVFASALILELLLSKIFSVIFKSNYVGIVNTPIYRIIVSGIIYFSIYLIYYFVKKLKFKLPMIERLNKHSKKLLIINLVLAIFIISFQFFLMFYYSDSYSLIINILSTISIIAYFIISVLNFVSTSELSITAENLEHEQLSKQSLQVLYDDIRGFKHDFGNILNSMGGYISVGDISGLQTYYHQLLIDYKLLDNLATLDPNIINNHAIYNVLASKYHRANKLGIKINLEIFIDLNSIHMDIYEFTRIFGILMDNAIEAAKECDEKIINICIRKADNRNMQVLIIENTYTNKEVNTDNIFQKGVSSKPGNTGLGLWEVRKILTKHNNLNLFTTINEPFFRQQLEIFY